MKKALIVAVLTVSAQQTLANSPEFLVCFTSTIPATNSSITGEMLLEETIRHCINSQDNTTNIVARIIQCDSRAKKITDELANIHLEKSDWKATYNSGSITISVAGADNHRAISATGIPSFNSPVILEYGEPYSEGFGIEVGTAIVCNVRQLKDYVGQF